MVEFLYSFYLLINIVRLNFAQVNFANKIGESPKAHTKTDTSSQEKLFGEIQNSFLLYWKI